MKLNRFPVWAGAVAAIEKADVLIVGGTSLNVYPAAGLIDYYRGNKLVLINQYRVPINKYIYELPAGLVDNNEDVETSVRRELKEETGLDLISINKINSKDKLYLSPGMTDESVAFVYCLCDGEITDKYQEDDEDIKAMLISKEEAKNILENEESIDIKAYLMLQIFEKLGESLFI